MLRRSFLIIAVALLSATYQAPTAHAQSLAKKKGTNPPRATHRIRVPEYLFRLSDEQMVYVSTGSGDYYRSFRLFVGSSKLKRVSVKDVERLRDGGTTYIYVKGGYLYCPSPMASMAGSSFAENERYPTWKGKRAVKLDMDQYKILEKGDTATISKKH